MATQIRDVVTLHAPLGKQLAEELIEVILISLKELPDDVTRAWIDRAENGTDLVVKAEFVTPVKPPRRGR